MTDETEKTPVTPPAEQPATGPAPLSDGELNEVAGGFTSPFSSMSLDQLNSTKKPGPQ
ncbi:hypothetical protein GCM10007301_49990 [Azorhizobium oxalatiphilum]|uniref:Uncharacterized protein n=1 Tax=Azorhizobium oxalatiphilum TaxID=980631 RepID=A0A917CCW7_9HYPH|nr:hypothetical protein [Azorhizobium oxalatiphilum]GGF83998.1 hypothetical protein GCM10007301_49990 [Azorhizobium oxalatiphilum]